MNTSPSPHRKACGSIANIMQRSLVDFLYGIAVAKVLTWSNTHYVFKPTGNMALIGKTGFKGRIMSKFTQYFEKLLHLF
jgi:hypothetical protein